VYSVVQGGCQGGCQMKDIAQYFFVVLPVMLEEVVLAF